MKIQAPPRWRPRLSRQNDNLPLLDWLRERASLTARLRRGSRSFQVRCLRQALEALGPDEAACLGARPGRLVWVREVLLLVNERPAVFAHTVMTRRPRHPFDLRFAALGSHSLGSLLFSDPRIARGPLEFRPLDRRHLLYRRAEQACGPLPPRLWARRSRFGRQAKGVLVTELFLPPVLDLPGA